MSASASPVRRCDKPQQQSRVKTAATLVAGIFGAGLVAMLCMGICGWVQRQWRYRDVAHWIEVPAEVSVQITYHPVLREDPHSGMSVDDGEETTASYTYVVNGQTYRGDVIGANGSVRAASLPSHPSQVFYDPADPEDAVLVSTPPSGEMAAFLVMILSVPLGALAAFFGAKEIGFRLRLRGIVTAMARGR